jgi:parallel beta-helix repeat protein
MFASKMTINYPNLDSLIEPYTVIDASDQWDREWPGGQPGVRIGEPLNSTGVLTIYGDYAAVYGVEFTGESSKGIVVNGSKGTVIGGTESGQRNAFSVYNFSVGVEIIGGASKTDVRGNFFGTVYGRNAYPGWYGIYMLSGDNFIRENQIVGQTEAGIFIRNPPPNSGHNLIMDNIIGTTPALLVPSPNKIGIVLNDTDENQIGPGNDISENTQEGILIERSDNNLVMGNKINTNGSHGINIIGSVDNRIGIFKGNSIKYNKGYGIIMLQVDNTQVLQNQICANKNDGIYLFESQNNTIGGPLDGQENTITMNDYGIHFDTGANDNTVLGNHIGFSLPDCGYGNHNHGVLIENGASDNHIGGLEPGKGNWIGNNHKSGIYITGSGTTGNVVEGNVIGAELDWSQETPNSNHGIAIYDGASSNWIGWFNTILASGWSGVAIVNSDNNVVWLNYIGTNGADINWGNKFFGVNIVNGSNNQIFGNGIHNNGTHGAEAGVRIQGAASTNNFISINSIHANGGLGIELLDGSNSSQPAPTITSGSCATGVSGTSCPGCIVEIFSDTDDEGLFFEESVTADSLTGAFSWTGSPAGPNLTATATKAALGPTSQFSAPFNIGVCNNPPIAAFTYTPNEVYTCIPVAFDASSSSDVEDPVSALQVRWDWENDGTYDTTLSNQKTTQHSFNSSGVQTIRLEVQDTDGLTDATTRVVTVGACGSIFIPIVFH